jgi:hypothetical protein
MGMFVYNNVKSLFSSSEEEDEFKDMFHLFTESARSNIMLDFCYYQRGMVLFPLGNQNSHSLSKDAFMEIMSEKDYCFVVPEVFRRKFCEYVFTNEFRVRTS